MVKGPARGPVAGGRGSKQQRRMHARYSTFGNVGNVGNPRVQHTQGCNVPRREATVVAPISCESCTKGGSGAPLPRPAACAQRQNAIFTPSVMLRPISGAALLMNEVCEYARRSVRLLPFTYTCQGWPPARWPL